MVMMFLLSPTNAIVLREQFIINNQENPKVFSLWDELVQNKNIKR